MFLTDSQILQKLWKRKLVKDAFALYSGRGINLLVGLLSTLIYGIIFMKTQIALISLFEMVASLFLSLGFTWSAFGIVKFGKEELIRTGGMHHSSSIRLNIGLPLLVVSILAVIIFRKPILAYIGTNDNSIIIYLVLNIALLVFHEHVTTVVETAERHVWNVVYFLGQSMGKLILLSIFYFKYLDTSAELYIKLNVWLLVILVFLRLPSMNVNYFLPIERVKKKDVIPFLRFVVPQIYGFAGLYLINWMDVYFIRLYCDLNELGAYQFLYSLFMKVASLALILNNLFFPRMVAWKLSDQNKLSEYLRQVPYYVFLFCVIGIGALIATYRPLFSYFFGEKYIIAYSSFNVLLLAVPFYFLTYIFVPLLNTYERVNYIQVVNIISAASNFLIDLFLIRYFGIIAAAIGTFTAFYLKYLLLLLAVKRMFNKDYKLLIITSSVIFLSVIFYAIAGT